MRATFRHLISVAQSERAVADVVLAQGINHHSCIIAPRGRSDRQATARRDERRQEVVMSRAFRTGKITTFARDDAGSVLPLIAGMVMALVGATALGVEVVSWYVAKSELQRVADNASVQGMYAYRDTSDTETALKQAVVFASINGRFTAVSADAVSCSGSTCTYGNNLTATLLDVSGSKRVKVTATESLQSLLGNVFGSSATTISVSATARMGAGGTASAYEACILGLNPDAGAYGYMQSGTADVTLDNCTIRSNSNLNLVGDADATVLGAFAAKDINGSAVDSVCPTKLVTTPNANNCHTNAGAKTDPYASQMASVWADANTGGTTYTQGGSPSSEFTLAAGYFNSITIKRTTYLCGVYYVSGNVQFTSAYAKAKMATGCTTGVSFVAKGSIQADGQATIELEAPSTGVTKGIVFASDYTEKTTGSESATESLQNYVQGGANAKITGALYFPNASIRFAGNSNSGTGTACTQIVAWTIRVTGTSGLGNSCTSIGTTAVADTGSGESATVMLAK